MSDLEMLDIVAPAPKKRYKPVEEPKKKEPKKHHTSKAVMDRYRKKHLKSYTVSFRLDGVRKSEAPRTRVVPEDAREADSDIDIINFIEHRKSLGESPTALFRRAIRHLMNERE